MLKASDMKVTAGAKHSCAVDQAGGVYCFGDNSKGQTAVPVLLRAKRVRVVAAGLDHTYALQNFESSLASCAVTVDAEMICWGKVQGSVPQVAFDAVTAGWGYTCGILKGGNGVLCWGDAAYGKSVPPPRLLGCDTAK